MAESPKLSVESLDLIPSLNRSRDGRGECTSCAAQSRFRGLTNSIFRVLSHSFACLPESRRPPSIQFTF
jgi:hypothetical protein